MRILRLVALLMVVIPVSVGALVAGHGGAVPKTGGRIDVSLIVILIALLVLSIVFSAMEAAILSINKVRLRHLVESGNRSAELTYEFLKRLDRVIGTLVVGYNMADVALSTIGSWVFVSQLGPERGLAIGTPIITIIVVLVCEVAPKTFAATHPEVVAFSLIHVMRPVLAALYPLAVFFTWASRWLLRLLRVPTRRKSPLVTEEEIKVMIQMGREAGVLAEDERRMLHRIFEFSDSLVREAMVPRSEISGVDLEAKPAEILDVLVEEGHSRIPVYRGSLDHVEGVIYARDLLAMMRHGGLFVLADLIRPVAFVPETKRVAELLSEFQRDKTQIAIVRSTKGKIIGLVTLEDLLEEIVGEIEEAPRHRRA